MSIQNGATARGCASDTELVTAVRRRIAQNPGAFVTLKQIAHAFKVKPKRLTMAFQNILGLSVAQYVRRERLQAAQRLLLQTSRPIRDIAEELGFSCSANFASAFRMSVGMSPSEYRRDPHAHRDLTTRDVKWGEGPV